MAHVKRKKIEFSKILVAWALLVTTISALASYLLALLDHAPCEEITIAIAEACIAIAVAYEAKSYGEKNSRNKYGIDEFGNRIDSETSSDG